MKTAAEYVQHLIDRGAEYVQQPGESDTDHRDRLKNYQDQQVFGLSPYTLAQIGARRRLSASEIYEVLAKAMGVSATKARTLVRDAVATGSLVREGESTATEYTTPAEVERREAARLALHEKNVALATEAERLGLQVALKADRWTITRRSVAEVRPDDRIRSVRVASSVEETIALLREARNGCC